MHAVLKSALCASLTLSVCVPAQAQTMQVACQGTLLGAPAVISGLRQFAAYNALGDGQVRFEGRVVVGGTEGQIGYDGYPQAGLPKGFIVSPRGSMTISVLENVNTGRMTIYDGTPRHGAPNVVGEFVCALQ